MGVNGSFTQQYAYGVLPHYTMYPLACDKQQWYLDKRIPLPVLWSEYEIALVDTSIECVVQPAGVI